VLARLVRFLLFLGIHRLDSSTEVRVRLETDMISDHAPTPGGRPPASQLRFLHLSRGRLAYDDTGTGAPLALCVPGMGDLRSQFRLLRPQLTSLGLRVATLDLRGTGDSSVSWSSYTPKDVAGDMTALLLALNAGPAVLVANSMAAASAICVAANEPPLVRALVLLGPVPRDHPGSALTRAAARLAFRGPWGASAWASYYRGLYPSVSRSSDPDAWADLQEHIHSLKANLHQPGRLRALRGFIEASKADCSRLARRVGAPVLAVMGSKDPDVPDPAAELNWLRQETGAQTLLLEGVGHYPHVEALGPTWAAIEGFLREMLRRPEPIRVEREEVSPFES
jgi:pimeloyl-ACP methyl ester carboxylesterase